VRGTSVYISPIYAPEMQRDATVPTLIRPYADRVSNLINTRYRSSIRIPSSDHRSSRHFRSVSMFPGFRVFFSAQISPSRGEMRRNNISRSNALRDRSIDDLSEACHNRNIRFELATGYARAASTGIRLDRTPVADT